MTIAEALNKLKMSKFRSRFHLTREDVDYIEKNGLEKIEAHGRDFIKKRLSPSQIENDGEQTPMKGHPIFKAQHACACCCRTCLARWYRVPKNTALTESQQEKILKLLMAWITEEINRIKSENKI